MIKTAFVDIDGTLVYKVKRRQPGENPYLLSLRNTCQNHFGISKDVIQFENQKLVRTTCYGDMLSYLEFCGIDNKLVEEKNHKQFIDSWDRGYLKLVGDSKIFESIGQCEKFLQALRHHNILGILTGSLPMTALKKLDDNNLKEYFSFFATGNLSPDRSDLFVYSKQEAERILSQKISAREILVVGDTRNDVRIAKEFGTPFLGVASSKNGIKKLKSLIRSELPDENTFVTNSYEDVAKIIDWVKSL